MRLIILTLSILILAGCSNNQRKVADYREVHKILIKDDAYKLFEGVHIVPRDGVELDPNFEDYYIVMLSEPLVDFYGDPMKPDKMDLSRLINLLWISDSLTSQARADSILVRMQKQIAFMKSSNIRAVVGNTNKKAKDPFWDFILSQTEYLRYGKSLSSRKLFPDNVISVMWIDSNWAYCKTKSHYE